MKKPVSYIGLDVHKEAIAVALAEAGKRGEVWLAPAFLLRLTALPSTNHAGMEFSGS